RLPVLVRPLEKRAPGRVDLRRAAPPQSRRARDGSASPRERREPAGRGDLEVSAARAGSARAEKGESRRKGGILKRKRNLGDGVRTAPTRALAVAQATILATSGAQHIPYPHAPPSHAQRRREDERG
ncbi:unnamed protein product, partial [Prorocentrum cordatum]